LLSFRKVNIYTIKIKNITFIYLRIALSFRKKNERIALRTVFNTVLFFEIDWSCAFKLIMLYLSKKNILSKIIYFSTLRSKFNLINPLYQILPNQFISAKK
jgi:hypothetical protein